jgi:polysaccharide biosynthesis/export protein
MSPRSLTCFGALAALALGCAPAGPSAPAGPPEPQWSTALAAVVDSTPRAAVTPSDGTQRAGALRLGPNDLLEITVFEAPELNRSVRVSGAGQISLPLLGEVSASGLTPRELEVALEATLRQRYIRDPHVSVEVSEMQSHAVSVVGAVTRPGVFQIRESRPLLELIALAGGLAPNAGESVIVARAPSVGAGEASAIEPGGGGGGGGGAAAESMTISLRALLESGDQRHNVLVHPGDMVKVTPAGLVYVVGEVRKPGAFPLVRGPSLTVLQAIALGEGLGPKAARGRTIIIRTGPAGERVELPVNLGDVLAGRAVDVALQPQDVVFVPSSAAKAVTMGVVDALVRMVTLKGVF